MVVIPLSREPLFPGLHISAVNHIYGSGQVLDVIRLSNRQRKNADRVGGIELVIPWPDHLPRPALREDGSRPATPAEFDAARAALDPGAGNAGLAIKRVTAVCLRRHRHDPPDVYLAVWLVGFRWFDARWVGNPPLYWATE